MIFRLYQALWWLLLPFIILLRLIKDRKSPLYGHPLLPQFKERLGLGGPLVKAHNQGESNKIFLLHAVSLGEVRAITPFIRLFVQKFPHITLLITTTTLTGSLQIQESFKEELEEQRILTTFLPLDHGGLLKQFLKKYQPAIILVMETEIWPNLFYQAHRLNIPLLMISACLSSSSFSRYQKLKKPIKRLLSPIQVLAQTDEDVERFKALGVEKIKRMGNIKYDLSVPSEQIEPLYLLKAKRDAFIYWLVASTHEGEEALVLEAYQTLKQDFPQLKLVLVPRHPERFPAVERLIHASGLTYIKRSETSFEAFTNQADLWLIDSIGELLIFYAFADIALVGGSFVPIGGHNILEPAYFAKPIIVGPYMEENQETLTFFKKNKAIIQTNAKELPMVLSSLVNDKKRRLELGERAKQTLVNNQGASHILFDELSPFTNPIRNIDDKER